MKSVFNKIEKEKPKEIEFPVLAESIHNDFVVLFTDETSGIVMKNSKCNIIGDFCDNYMPLYDTTTWRILSSEESVVLSND